MEGLCSSLGPVSWRRGDGYQLFYLHILSVVTTFSRCDLVHVFLFEMEEGEWLNGVPSQAKLKYTSALVI